MKKFSLLLTLVMLVSLFGVASPAPVAADPIPGNIVQIPVIQVGSGWETWIQVQNVGLAPGKFGLLLFGYTGEYCGPQCTTKTKLEMSGLVPVGAAWTYKLFGDVTCGTAFTPKSGILVSLSKAQWEAAETVAAGCAGATVVALWKAGTAAGEKAAVSVNRIQTTGTTPRSAAYTGIYGNMEGKPDPRTGAYMYYAPMLFDSYSISGWSSTIWIQNSGNECTSLEIWIQKQQDCLKNQILQVLALCPGETVIIDLTDPKWGVNPGFMGSAWIRASQPLGVIVDEYNGNGSILMSYRGMPAALWAVDGSEYFIPGSLFNFAPLIYREYNGWNTGIRVQNLSSIYNALVKVYFIDNSGDIIDTIVEWICPRGSQTFYLAAINTLPGQYVGQARIESQNWWGPGDPQVAAPYVLSVVNLVNYVSGQGAAYNAFPKQEVLQTVFGKYVGLPFLAKDKHDQYEPTGTHWTSEIAMTNLDMLPGVSVYRIDFFDQNGLLYSLCQTLNEKQVDYIKLGNIGIIPTGWLGSAIISWQCSSTSPADVGALGVVVVELAHGYPSGDLTKVYEGFPLSTRPLIATAVDCPECLQLCKSVKITGKVSNGGTGAIVLGGATVELWSYGPNQTWDGATAFVGAGDDYLYATTTSSSTGYYEFVNVAAAPLGQDYRVVAKKTGYDSKHTEVLDVVCGVDRTTGTDIAICMGNINGTARVTPFTAPGAAFKNATVELWQKNASGVYVYFTSALTNSEGFFEFLAQPGCSTYGNYELKFLFLCGGNTVSVISDLFTLNTGVVLTRNVEVDLDTDDGQCSGRWFTPQ
jgi:hypothetical protein